MPNAEVERYLESVERFRMEHPDFDFTLAEALPGQRPFTEQLLVCLIWGRPELIKKDDAEERRLAKAYKGLFGQKSTFTSQSRYRYSLLLEVEQEFHAQRWDVERGARSKVDTYEKLAERFAKRDSEVSQLRRDIKKFIEARQHLDANTLLEFETLQRLALEAIESIVQPFGVKFFHYD